MSTDLDVIVAAEAAGPWDVVSGRRNGPWDIVLFDAQDEELWYSRKWYLSKVGYATSQTPRPIVYFHRLVMGATFGDGRIVDHVNQNKLDNRRSNLRFVTKSRNMLNRGSMKHAQHPEVGVSPNPRGGWTASVRIDGHQQLKHFSDEQDAIDAARAMRSNIDWTK